MNNIKINNNLFFYLIFKSISTIAEHSEAIAISDKITLLVCIMYAIGTLCVCVCLCLCLCVLDHYLKDENQVEMD